MLYCADVGHSFFKGLSSNGARNYFPSVLGETHRQYMDQNGYIQIETDEGGPWFVGEGAIEQSLNQFKGQDRTWALTKEYRALLLAGISECLEASTHEVKIDLVTGLPMADYDNKDELVRSLKRTWQVKRPNKRNLKVSIENILVVPQSLSVLSETPKSDEVTVILDIGGRNINYSTFLGLKAISSKSGSTETGTLNMLNQIGKKIAITKGRHLNPHQVIKSIQSKTIRIKGKEISVDKIINDEIDSFYHSVLALISSVWKDTSDIDRILVVGGGAFVVGHMLEEKFPQVILPEEPQWANVNGYMRLGKRWQAK